MRDPMVIDPLETTNNPLALDCAVDNYANIGGLHHLPGIS
jgi:hypothetical protein